MRSRTFEGAGLGGLTVLVAALATAAPSPADLPARALLEKADRVRTAIEEGVLRLRVTLSRPGTPEQAGEFLVSVKGPDRVRVDFLSNADAGTVLILRGDDTWLQLPKTRNPIRVPRSYRVTGGFGVADVARTRLVEDYDAVLEAEASFQDRPCDILRLTERKGRRPAFPVLRLFIDRKEGLIRRMLFLLPSGRTARDVSVEAYGPIRGTLSILRMRIVDVLRSGTTEVETLDAQRKALPEELFDPLIRAPRPATPR